MTDDDLNTSFARLQRMDLDDLDDIVGCKAQWVDKVLRKLNVDLEENLRHHVFNSSSITKVTLAQWTGEARDIMTRQGRLISEFEEILNLMKTEALADKAAVIRLQSELLKNKESEIESMKTAVQETVNSSVQAGIQSYSSAVSSNIPDTAPVFTPDTLKKAVRTAMVEEDRSRNLLIFGLAEQQTENVEESVSELFIELGDNRNVLPENS